MAEAVTIVANRVTSRRRPTKCKAVSASALAQHLDCTRTYIGKLEAQGVIQRKRGGFPLDESRVAYLRYLRRERRQSSRSEADADHVRAKTEMLQLRLAEKRRELVRREDVDALIDELAGITVTHLSGMAARCSRDMQVRRNIDSVVFQIRREMAEAALAKADEWKEPPPD
ncbi:hypothetical protein [Bradyrhizobium sp. UFLA05-112]